MGENLQSKLKALIEPLVTAMGYELWGLELHKQKVASLLRVYIDSERGVNLDDCSRVSYQISGVLDVEDIVPYRYTLEVSSPGLDRQLFEKKQYRQFIGSKIRIRITSPNRELKERRNYAGVLETVTEDSVTIISEGEKIVLPFDKIERAQLIPSFEVKHHEQ